jgi:hypothetical protein
MVECSTLCHPAYRTAAPSCCRRDGVYLHLCTAVHTTTTVNSAVTVINVHHCGLITKLAPVGSSSSVATISSSDISSRRSSSHSSGGSSIDDG